MRVQLWHQGSAQLMVMNWTVRLWSRTKREQLTAISVQQPLDCNLCTYHLLDDSNLGKLLLFLQLVSKVPPLIPPVHDTGHPQVGPAILVIDLHRRWTACAHKAVTV